MRRGSSHVNMPAIGLGNRRFAGMLGASAISGVGDGLVAVAFPLLAAMITRDPLAVAGVAVAQRAPWLLLSLHGGALVDRTSLRRLLPLTELLRAATLAALALLVLSGDVDLPVVYLAAFAIGTGDTIVASGLHTAVPLLAADDLNRANGRIEITQVSGDSFVGPAIGGALFAAAAWAPFAVDALSFLVAGVLLARVLPARPATARTATLNADVAEGLRWFLASRPLRLLALVIALFAFFQAAVLSLLVLLTTGQLGLSEGQFGLFLTLGAAGNIAGALLVGRFDTARVHLVVVAAGVVTATGYVVMGVTGSAIVAGAAFAMEGAALAVANIVTVTLRQTLIPQRLLGRVGAAFRLCLFGAMPLGALAGGLVASATSVGTATWMAGLAQLGVVCAAAPALRRQLSDRAVAIAPEAG